MNKLVLIILISFLIGCAEKAPAVAGKMDESTVCSTSGYIIRKNLGKAFKTAGISCTVKNIGGNSVEIKSGYTSPLGPTLYYTAIGVVSGNNLKLEKIKVQNIDNDFVPFYKFKG